jgi:N6-adenosine-specific RNA methylase IME4
MTCNARHNVAADVLALDYAALQREHGSFLVVMINVPWHLDKPEWAGYNSDASRCSTRRVTAEQFLALDFFAAIPCGFVFVWVEKEYLAEIVLHMEQRQFNYVENFVWVKLLPNGEPYRGASPVFAKTKASMLLFVRKGDIVMRHQRSSDTVLEIIPPAYDDFDTKPESAFEAIEALVPTSDFERPRFLELWAPLGRAGAARLGERLRQRRPRRRRGALRRRRQRQSGAPARRVRAVARRAAATSAT